MLTVIVDSETIFQALSDQTRIRILRLLIESGEEACLCELADSLEEESYKLSRHLKVLRQAGVLSAEKDGRWIYHKLVRGVPHLNHLYASVKSLPDTRGVFVKDQKIFKKRRSFRQGGRCKTESVSRLKSRASR